MKGYLVLEDGTVFEGTPFGAPGRTLGEVVFNTGMTGYQEVLTDPSYAGQIVVLTYPLVGNYGINESDDESAGPKVRGFVVHEVSDEPSHWKSRESISDYLFRHGIMGLAGVDTRALTHHLRDSGTLRGVMATAPAFMPKEQFVADLAERARRVRLPRPAEEVTTPKPYRIYGAGPRIALIDFGVKQNILRQLAEHDCEVTVLPALTPASEIMALRPDAVLLSNGPGDPSELTEAVDAARAVAQSGVPTFGICLGHQILALAFGARTYRLKFGHRGVNHPVKDLATGRVYVTSQNHGYAVDEETLPPDLEVTHRNVNDGTIEGLRHRSLPVRSVQYHPEAGPGPEDSRYLIEEFLAGLRR